MMRLGNQSVTVVRPGAPAEDEYHNEIPGEASRHVIDGCSVQPGTGGVFLDRREATTTVYTVFAPKGADVRDTDRVEYAGVEYDVDGSVQRWDVGSALDHVVVPLKSVRG